MSPAKWDSSAEDAVVHLAWELCSWSELRGKKGLALYFCSERVERLHWGLSEMVCTHSSQKDFQQQDKEQVMKEKTWFRHGMETSASSFSISTFRVSN